MSVDDEIKAYKNKKLSEYSKQYRATHPEYVEGRKQYMKEYQRRPEVVAYRKEYYARPEVMERRRVYSMRPEVAEHRRERQRKRYADRYKNDPDFRAKSIERNRAYRQRMKLLKKQQAESTKGESTGTDSTNVES